MLKEIPLYRLELVRERSFPVQSVLKTEQCAEVLHQLLDRSPVEQFVVVYADASGNLVGVEKIAIGSLTYVDVAISDIFRGAISAAVPNIILGHNHPNDNVTPSGPDWELTNRAIEAGIMIGISVQDHIIVGPGGKHFSMRDEMLRKEDAEIGRVMDLIDRLPQNTQSIVKEQMKKFGLNMDELPRSEKLTSNDKDILNLFGEKPWIRLPA